MGESMNREQVLNLYDWAPGVCFRHPSRGQVQTTVVGVIHPQADGEREVRGCEECVITMEDVRREAAARSGSEYTPGHLGKCLG
jgi:hypothetical protein